MKNRFFLLLVSVLLILSCEKTKYENSGTITGADPGMCMCCGGYFIDIDGTQYRFEKSALPAGFSFDDKQLPLQVELNWDLKESTCSGFNWIKVSKIRKK